MAEWHRGDARRTPRLWSQPRLIRGGATQPWLRTHGGLFLTFGALLALLLGEKITLPLVVAGALMAIGIWLT